MNRTIMEFSNRWFYGGKLIAHQDVADWNFEGEEPLNFIDTAGAGWEEHLSSESKSVSNPNEASFLLKRVKEFIEKHPNEKLSIGVISPYKQQTQLLQNLFSEENQSEAVKIDIQTVDSFQGQERDAIFVSLVRSNDSQEIGFLKDYRRMNVAMTRAKKKLVVIGDSATLAKDAFYKAFIEFSEEISAYHSVWEFEEFS